MSCARLSLFTNVTLCPAVIVTLDGDTAPLAIVMVAPLGPGLPLGGVGDIGDPPSLPPQAIATAINPAAAR